MNSLWVPATTPSLHDLAPTSSVTDCVASLRQGNWKAAGLDSLVLGVETAGVVADPIGSVISLGAEWAMEHLQPLTSLLDMLAGQPEVVLGKAHLAARRAGQVRDELDEFNTSEWSGAAGEAFRHRQRFLAEWASSSADALEATGDALGQIATVIDAVRSFVRGLIADVVATLVKWGTATAVTGGVASPGLVLRATTKVAAAVQKAARWVRAVSETVSRLDGLLRSLASAVGDLSQHASALSRGHRAAPQHRFVPQHRGTSRTREVLDRLDEHPVAKDVIRGASTEAGASAASAFADRQREESSRV